MAEATVLVGDLLVKGRISSWSLTPPASAISNSHVASDAAIAATKLLHLISQTDEIYASGTTVAALAAGKACYIAKGPGTLTDVRAYVYTPANDVSRTVTVDLQKSTAGGAFATVLSGTVGFTNSSVALTLVTGTISTPSYVAGDLFRWVVSVAGGGGTQAAGLTASFVAYEATT
jgi:hypothetical protein